MTDRPVSPLRSYDALRGLQALAPILIFTAHWWEGVFAQPPRQAQICIDFFLAIEGFLSAEMLAHAGPHASSRKLIAGRLLKLYPLYLLGLSLGLLMARLSMGGGLEQGSRQIIESSVIANTLLLPSFNDPIFVFPLNPPTWAIALEVYVFVVFCCTRKWHRLRVLIPCVLAAAGWCAFAMLSARNYNLGFAPQTYWGGYPRCLFGFFYGVLLYHLVRRYGPILPRVSPVIIWCVFVGLVFLPVRFIGLPLLLVAMPLVVWLAAAAANPSWLHSSAQFAGRISYGIYLLGYPVLVGTQYVVDRVGVPHSEVGILAYYVATLALVVLAAYVSVLFLRRGLSLVSGREKRLET